MIINHWSIIFRIISNIPDNAPKEIVMKNLFAIEKVIETYPCRNCLKHYQEYFSTHSTNKIRSKRDLYLYINNYKKNIDHKKRKGNNVLRNKTQNA